MSVAKETLAKIDAAIEAAQENGHRNHLGASVLGSDCTREIWYKWRWALREMFTGQQLRLFARGHLEEPRFISYLRQIGCEIWPHDVNAPLKDGQPQQWRVSFHDGHGGGSPDGVGRGGLPELAPNIPFLVSCKTHGDKSFNLLTDRGVMGSKFEHFVQEQIYMHFMGIKVSLYMAVNKNTDHLHLELLNYMPDVANNAINRAGNVIYANEPPKRIAESPGAYACKFCHFNRLCHFGDVTPDRNCRTCRFARPGAAGMWVCGLRNVLLDSDAQRAGCGSYQVHGKLTGIQQ